MSKILMTSENPQGWKLEALLDEVCLEIEEKSRKVLGIDHQTTTNYVIINAKILTALKVASALQKEAIKYAKENPIPSDLFR